MPTTGDALQMPWEQGIGRHHIFAATAGSRPLWYQSRLLSSLTRTRSVIMMKTHRQFRDV
jgi:hypothetical protein